MNDEVDKTALQDDGAANQEVDEPRAGGRLAAARREQQITVLEIAKELHLDEPKVRALEQNKFDTLGAPVFAKGHLRKYAMLVGVDIGDVLQDYYQLNRSSDMPPVVGKVRKQAREISPGPWIAAIVIILMAAIAYYWFTTQDIGSNILSPQPQPEEINDNTDAGPVEEPPADTITQETAAQVDASATDTDAQVDSVAQEPEAQAAPPVALAAGQVRLSMQFSGDCWTEITDANGQRLFLDLGQAGRSVDVSGQAPLSVLFGIADNVSVRVNGRDYPIAAADRRGETARLTIQSP